MRFDEEQRDQVRDCVRQSVRLSDKQLDAFVATLEISIEQFRKLSYGENFRNAHDALRQLWFHCNEDDPIPSIIRKGVLALPPMALEYLDRRFQRLCPQLAANSKFQEWVGRLNQYELPELQFIVAEGLRPVKGRSRGRGKQSEPHLEPIIMGVARGAGESEQTGGRPNTDARLEFVA
jgi:hypothetical protein